MRRGLEINASAIILVHNHPSGDATPSRADMEMTRQIVEAGRAVGIKVHDHIVIGAQNDVSFRSLGLLWSMDALRHRTNVTLVGGAPFGGALIAQAMRFAPVLIAADGGADRLEKLNLMPQTIIGDLGSLRVRW